MAKEQKETAITEKQQERVEKAQKTYETKYAISELAEAAKPLFGTNPVIVRAALKAEGRGEYTEKEAVKIVTAFMKKEVK